jgi:hypothetical protein
MHTLADLETYTEVVELKAGESLFHTSDGSLNEYRNRGLYFIEHGMLVSFNSIPVFKILENA